MRDRLWAKVEPEPNSGCWIWMGTISRDGYGKIMATGRKNRWVHRVSYELEHGPISDGLVIDHLCRNRLCANPKHLEAVTPLVNVRRGLATQTSCQRGHPLSGENLYLKVRVERVCRTCKHRR